MKALRKVIHPVGIAFKGSGFYKTDSRAPAGKGSSAPATDGSTPAGSTPDSSAASSTGSSGESSSAASSTPAASTSASTATEHCHVHSLPEPRGRLSPTASYAARRAERRP